MSTKCTILDTPGEHWYEDEVYQQYEEGGEGRCFVLEFDARHKFEPGPDFDPVEFPEGMIVTIRDDSPLYDKLAAMVGDAAMWRSCQRRRRAETSAKLDTSDKSYLFGSVCYQRIGELSVITIFGHAVYERAGTTRAVFGIVVTK